MAWKYECGTPIYIQVANHIMLDILSGEVDLGARLPNPQSMIRLTGVNSMTVKRAYDELCKNGIAEKNEAGEYFVANDADVISKAAEEYAVLRVNTFIDSLIGEGIDEATAIKAMATAAKERITLMKEKGEKQE